jgi:hypothetical protein
MAPGSDLVSSGNMSFNAELKPSAIWLSKATHFDEFARANLLGMHPKGPTLHTTTFRAPEL